MSAPAAPQVHVGAVAPARRRARRRWSWTNYLYILPTLLGMLFFNVGAVIYSFAMSFTRWEAVFVNWVGFANYQNLFASSLFWQTLSNTFYYTLGFVPLSMLAGLVLALLVNQKLRGITIYRSIYFAPVVTSTVAIALVFSWLYNPDYGLINYLLWTLFHIQGPPWLASTTWAMPALILLGVWKSMGFNMVIFLAGLQDIPEELYEAARIDGAGLWGQIRHVTLPLLSPTTFFVLIISIIGSFQVFDQTYVLTQGGPANATLTLSFFIYEMAFEWFHMGYAAALAYILFLVILVVTLIQWRLQGRWVFYR
jgi:multiple sugar transport system permease protein